MHSSVKQWRDVTIGHEMNFGSEKRFEKSEQTIIHLWGVSPPVYIKIPYLYTYTTCLPLRTPIFPCRSSTPNHKNFLYISVAFRKKRGFLYNHIHFHPIMLLRINRYAFHLRQVNKKLSCILHFNMEPQSEKIFLMYSRKIRFQLNTNKKIYGKN